MTVLTTAARDKLISCLRLWERPGTPAERDAAAAGAIRLLRAAGLSWEDVISRHPPAHDTRRFDPVGWRERARACLRYPDRLRPWERNFLRELAGFPTLSGKQGRILREIAERLDVAADAA